jgi:predicted dehydrogenase
MRNFLSQKDCRVAAICDLKAPAREATKKLVDEHYASTDCATYTDYRELIARRDIDAVLIATCDHWHVLVALEAARAGKAIYLEKPMGLSLAEDQALRATCRRYGTIFQFGTQQRSSRDFRFACELVRNGRIGKLHTINVWSPGSTAGGPRNIVSPPGWIDYDMWLGPAPTIRTRRTGSRISGGGSSRITPWAISRAGAFTRSTSPSGAAARRSSAR